MLDKSKLIKKKPTDLGQLPPDRESYEKIVTGYKFEVKGTGAVENFPKEAFWCAFCGCRGKHYIVVKRSDGTMYKVGKTCFERLGLVVPSSLGIDKSLVKVQATKENGKPEPESYDPVMDDIDKLLKDL